MSKERLSHFDDFSMDRIISDIFHIDTLERTESYMQSHKGSFMRESLEEITGKVQ